MRVDDLRNVYCINAAIGNENKMIQMDFVDVDVTQINIGATKVGTGGDVVEMVRIDDIISNGVSFIKIDVQGSELLLLAGADNLIKNSRPIMFVEVENNWLSCFNESSESLLNKLLSLDYILVRINTDYPCDHVAIPREKKHMLDSIMKDVGYPIDIIDAKRVTVNFDRKDGFWNILYGSYAIHS